MKNLFEILRSPKKADERLILSQAVVGKYDIGTGRLSKSAPYHPGDSDIRSNEIHVWTFSLDQPDEVVSFFTALLSHDELSRAARLRSESAWKRFTAGRGWLRLILNLYVGKEPAELNFTYGMSGKPQLLNDGHEKAAQEPPSFNLAHSNGVAMLAVGCSRDIGIDLEFIHPIPEIETIASRYFSPREWAALAVLPDKDKVNGFFNIWTCKEAFVKALGEGFSLPFNTFTVSIASAEISTTITLEGSDQDQVRKHDQRWLYLPVQAPQGYAAALVIQQTTN